MQSTSCACSGDSPLRLTLIWLVEAGSRVKKLQAGQGDLGSWNDMVVCGLEVALRRGKMPMELSPRAIGGLGRACHKRVPRHECKVEFVCHKPHIGSWPTASTATLGSMVLVTL